MKKIIIALLFINSAYATCMLERVKCSPATKFQNIYEIVKVSCAAPGGPVRTTETFSITNPLLSKCGPVARRDCLKPFYTRQLNTSRHNYFQAEIKDMGRQFFMRIDDRRFLPQGAFHISTPDADFMLLDGYQCKRSFR